MYLLQLLQGLSQSSGGGESSDRWEAYGDVLIFDRGVFRLRDSKKRYGYTCVRWKNGR